MSAARHIHPNQLAMFMSPGDLKNLEPNNFDLAQHYADYDDGDDGSADHSTFWESREMESDDRGLFHDIQREGVKQPVNVYHHAGGNTEIANGHHRISSASADSLVPVRHYAAPHHDFRTAVWDQQSHDPNYDYL